MKIRTALISLAAIISLSAAYAEELERIDIDYNQIEVSVTMNPSHYRDQLERFENGDSTLRLDEAALIYYGYPSTFQFDPTADYSDIREMFIKKDYVGTLENVKRAIKSDPVNLDLIVMGAISASESLKPEDQKFLENMQNRFNLIVSTIMSSGSGLDASSPFKLIRAADALIVLRNVLGVTDIVNDATADNILAYVFHFPQSQRDNILYFDITPQQNYFRK